MAAITFESVLEAARKKFSTVDASTVPGVLAYQFNITGKAEGTLYIEFKDGKVNVEPYEYYDRNATITINGTNAMKLLSGKLNPVVAFTTKKLEVEGDVNAALELSKFLK